MRKDARYDEGMTTNELKAILKEELGGFRDEIRGEFGEFRNEIRGELGEFRSEFDAFRAEVRTDIQQINTQLDNVEGRLGNVEGTADSMKNRLDRIEQNMTTKQDVERIDAHFTAIKEDLTHIEEEYLDPIRQGNAAVVELAESRNQDIKDVKNKTASLEEASQDHEDRLQRLEIKPASV
mgnify:CR=1 FL=1